MTAQCSERLIYKNNKYHLATEPLQPYLTSKGISFAHSSSNCWRGYIGDWLIEDKRLYLTGLKANVSRNEEVGLEYLFPNKEKVWAQWYSGKIRIPHGEMMQYVHQGYASLYEKELFLKIKKGVVVKQYERDNTHLYKNPAKMERRNRNDLMSAIFGGGNYYRKNIFCRILDKMKESLYEGMEK